MEKTNLLQKTFLLLCFLGPLLFIFSFIAELSLLGIIGIVIFAISISFLLISPQRYFIREIVGDSFLTTFINLNDFLNSMNLMGKGIYLPPRINDSRNFVFIPNSDRDALSKLSMIEGNRERKLLVKEGILLQSTGSSLINSLEKQFSIHFSELDLSSLKETLSTLLVNELNLMNNFYLEILENKVYCIFYGSIFLNLCNRINREIPEFCTKLGCPLSSAIACILTKITERYVLIEECIVKSSEKKIEATYRLLTRR